MFAGRPFNHLLGFMNMHGTDLEGNTIGMTLNQGDSWVENRKASKIAIDGVISKNKGPDNVQSIIQVLWGLFVREERNIRRGREQE